MRMNTKVETKMQMKVEIDEDKVRGVCICRGERVVDVDFDEGRRVQ